MSSEPRSAASPEALTPSRYPDGDAAGSCRWFHAEGAVRHAPHAAIVLGAAMFLPCATVAADGYYLRAGIGLDRPGSTSFTDIDCSSTAPAAL